MMPSAPAGPKSGTPLSDGQRDLIKLLAEVAVQDMMLEEHHDDGYLYLARGSR
jgi:hypothetical protein